MRTVAVVGASLAGLSVARSLRKQGYDGRLVVIGAERHRPYDRPPLSKEFLAGEIDETALTLEAEGEDLGAEWVLGATAVGLDLADRSVRLADGRSVRADGIVVATGAAARTLPGSDGLAGVHVLRTVDDAIALREDLARGGRLVVIGGGFIGAEVASTAYALGLEVTVVEVAPTPLAGPLGAAMGGVVSSLHLDHGVGLLCGVGVRGLIGGLGAPPGGSRGSVEAVLLEDGRSLPADVVVVGVGARPCVEWLEGSGIALENGVRCDADGSTNVPGVVAVGDCAAWYDPAAGAHRRVEHWTGARERPAAAVAALLSGGTATPEPLRPPYFWSDQYGVRIQFAGYAAGADSVTVEEGAAADRSFLAVYRSAGRPVAVLGMNQPRLFTRWRKQLAQHHTSPARSAP
ncbi:NAD(P)/FAD-dependent oxidoreductase [Actinacidiphila oryziradicis]|uniref:NAD(P)/FAD-dependent oxidoreductase n=1 Tax=Actinacidiphila oryziradicis TaxID=2571141 RepID=A0A4U0SGT6_9ACTN|nr:FAD-dependent oxidoreductase [Actinacidiphila oryziradicis]TKA08702.1 NAD(P)/FAD-dependent oxidoreductase [Actinacidiphila oryziradicis]